MLNKITNSQIAKKAAYYYTLQRTAFKSLIKSGEMPYAHYYILSLLEDRGQMRMGEISTIMAISRPNLTPLIDKLVDLQFVERIAHPHDRRVTYVKISDLGRLTLKNEHAIVIEGISSFTSKLTEQESEKFMAALDTISRIFSGLK